MVYNKKMHRSGLVFRFFKLVSFVYGFWLFNVREPGEAGTVRRSVEVLQETESESEAQRTKKMKHAHPRHFCFAIFFKCEKAADCGFNECTSTPVNLSSYFYTSTHRPRFPVNLRDYSAPSRGDF
jgi:hypothetical protein